MAESEQLQDMELSDSENTDPLPPGPPNPLKRYPSSDDISSDEESRLGAKPPVKKLSPPPNPSPKPPPSPSPSPSPKPGPSPKLPPRPSPSNSSSSLPRVKVYPDNAAGAGPWVVFFRPKPNGKALNVVQIMKDLGRYTSVSEIAKVRPNKLRVAVADRKQANAIVTDQHFTLEYRVYIPSRDVEIEGVVTEASLTCETIKREGVGMFKKLPSTVVNILDCSQLGTVSYQNGQKIFKQSDSFRVTFAGSALPDYVVIDKLRLPVRLFVPKPMTCENCKSLGHTASFCSNKPRCSTCGDRHMGEPCTAPEPKCPYCGNPPHDLSACDAYKSRRDKLKRSLKEHSKRSFAEILKSASPSTQPQSQPIQTTNVFDVLSENEVVADSANAGTSFIFEGTSRRRNATTPKVSVKTPPVPPVSMATKTSAADKQKQVPPGFRGFSSPKDNPVLEGTSKTPNVSFSSSESTSQSGFFKLSDIVDGIFTFFNVPDPLRSIVTAVLPIVKSFLQQLMETWPLLAMIISLDG